MVALTGVEDDNVIDETVALTLTIASSGADYAGKDATVDVMVMDNDKVPPGAPDGLKVIREERTQLYAQWGGRGQRWHARDRLHGELEGAQRQLDGDHGLHAGRVDHGTVGGHAVRGASEGDQRVR